MTDEGIPVEREYSPRMRAFLGECLAVCASAQLGRVFPLGETVSIRAVRASPQAASKCHSVATPRSFVADLVSPFSSVGYLYGSDMPSKSHDFKALRILSIIQSRTRRNPSRFVASAIWFAKNNPQNVSPINRQFPNTYECGFSLCPHANQPWHARCVTHFRRFCDKPNLAERPYEKTNT